MGNSLTSSSSSNSSSSASPSSLPSSIKVIEEESIRIEISGKPGKRKGKRPPKDPSLSVEQRLAKALAEQTLQQQSNNNTSSTIRTSPSRFASAGELVDLANRISVVEPTRRLRQKAPSSTGYSAGSMSSGSEYSDNSTGRSMREPVELRTFELLKVLGKGSHGKVFLVRHRGNGQLFAMKQLKKADVVRTKQLENTKREFRVHQMLTQQEVQCPNIAPLKYAFHSRSRLYMVFDYLSGGELYYHIGQRGRLPEALARFYGAQIVLALGYLHSHGIAYRDLKPENLLLDSAGNIHLVDLGLCKDGMHSATQGSSSFCGTTEYLAPEVLRYEEHGLAVDWWAFGMVLFEMLTGLPPWYSYDQKEVVQGILSKDLSFPSYLSTEAKDLISRLLEKDPSTRLGSASDVDDLIDHPFFKPVDWVALARKEVSPPFVPPDNGLACNFDSEFTDSKIEAERGYLPPSSRDPFDGFYFDCEDPIHCGFDAPESFPEQQEHL